MFIITEMTKTCTACPAQWEGKFMDGAELYVRYRYGFLSVRRNGTELFALRLGDALDGYLEYEQLKKILFVHGIELPETEQLN